MKLYPIQCGNFKLDGGAMFGVVPKSLWERTNPADSKNLIELGTRSLLVEDGKKLILIDCGLGNKQDEKFFGHYSLYGDESLDKNLKKFGFVREDITDVFLTHLHFDHCGGAIEWNDDKSGYRPAFKNAQFWTNENHWQWATEPNPREKASFLKENILPMQESGQLQFLPTPKTGNYGFAPDLKMDVIFVDGHTEKQMLPVIQYQEKTIVFAADLIPTAGHIPQVYVMGYDTRPLLTMEEKGKFLKQCVENEYLLFFEHDAHHELASLKMFLSLMMFLDTKMQSAISNQQSAINVSAESRKQKAESKIIGITGGIGSGKSTVSKFIEELGFPVYDSDFWAKELVNVDENLKSRIIELLGEESYDENGKYNRKFVAENVFENQELLLKLNQIIHPAVKIHFENWVNAQNAEFVFKETALLFELKLNESCYQSILVTADENIRIKRVMDRDGRTYREVKEIIDKQMPEVDKVKLADFVIQNNTDLESLKEFTHQVIDELQRMDL